jgi:hypothetical protein
MTTSGAEERMAAGVDRRAFLQQGAKVLGGVALLGSAGAFLEACGKSSKKAATTATTAAGSSGTVAPGSLGELKFQLPWIKNVESAGEFIADDEGIYVKHGFSKVTLIAAGPNATPQETILNTNQALVGITSLDSSGASSWSSSGPSTRRTPSASCRRPPSRSRPRRT